MEIDHAMSERDKDPDYGVSVLSVPRLANPRGHVQQIPQYQAPQIRIQHRLSPVGLPFLELS